MLLFLARVAMFLAAAFAVGTVTGRLTRPKGRRSVSSASAAKDVETSPARASFKDDAPLLVGAVAGETGSDVGGSNLLAEHPPALPPASESAEAANPPFPVAAASGDGGRGDDGEALVGDRESPRPDPLAGEGADHDGPPPKPFRSNWAESGESLAERPIAGLDAPRDGRPDNLTLISGIGPSIERLLFEHGVFHFDQIAAWTEADAHRIDALTGFEGRVEREDWIGQSRRFAGETGLP